MASSACPVYGIGLEDRERLLAAGGVVLVHRQDVGDRRLGDGVDLVALFLRGIHPRERAADAMLYE